MSKTLECQSCNAFVRHCSDRTGKVTCWFCVMKAVDPPTMAIKVNPGYPRGWRFMKLFVHVDGTVYHRGVEQPELKHTLPPTPITVKPRLTKAERRERSEQALVQIAQLKTQLKGETRKTAQKKLQTQIKKLQKQV